MGCRVESKTVLLMRWFPFILRFLASKGRMDQDGRRRRAALGACVLYRT
jgi:hypothetical protein